MIHKIVGKQPNSRHCLVCGMKNTLGLKAFFYETEKKELIAVFRPNDDLQSYPGRLHGGITTAILDETIGRAILMHHEAEMWGVTLEINVKFRKPVPLNEELKVIGRITSETPRYFEGTGELILPNGDIAATAEGKYLKMPIEKIADFDREANDWHIVNNENDPSEIDIK